MVDNKRFFHVRNRASGLCVISVPVPLLRTFRFWCQTVQKKIGSPWLITSTILLQTEFFRNLGRQHAIFSCQKTGQVDFVWFQFRCRCTEPSDFIAKLFRKKSAFHIWSLPHFNCRPKLFEIVVDNMRFCHVKNRAGWLCVIHVPVPLHRSFRFQCQTVQKKIGLPCLITSTLLLRTENFRTCGRQHALFSC
jgi:hypothetical protein